MTDLELMVRNFDTASPSERETTDIHRCWMGAVAGRSDALQRRRGKRRRWMDAFMARSVRITLRIFRCN